MKRYKKDDALTSILQKYRYTFLFGFIALFVILSLILGFSAYFAISRNYLSSSKMTIKNYITSITEANEPGDDPGRPRPAVSAWPNDPRMVVQYFYEDNTTQELKSVLVGIDEKTDESVRTAYAYAFSTRDFNEDLGEFKISEINNYTTLSYTERINDEKELRISIGSVEYKVKYIKVYMNVEGEESARTQFVNIYFACAAAMLALSIVAGLIMAKQGIKPLRVFVQKQVDFVNDASHELRTPLAVVQSKIETILANPDQSVYDASESLAIALNEINRLNKLTSELLTLARNDKDNIKFDFELINVNDELKKIVEPFIEIATLQDRKLEYIGSNDVYGYLDKDKLKQIMIIHIDNALKYTEVGDDITISLTQTNSDFTITVADTGIGINEYTKEHIFERFYREDKARSRETGGNGLGLSIAYTLVNLQRGKIYVDHNSPKGTKFTITFPRVKAIKKEESN